GMAASLMFVEPARESITTKEADLFGRLRRLKNEPGELCASVPRRVERPITAQPLMTSPTVATSTAFAAIVVSR
ncbi:MAG: hypothetical protein ABIR62_09290, partial [Dokdonella sp.]|uniref:hypothetical protein n=1 Tax=Dokdonella sp. TaxID=2291710 RepID=UPI00326638D0